MKKLALSLALIFALLTFVACGNAETDGKKEAEIVEVYDFEDILGCWYGTNADGAKYLLRFFENETSVGVEYRFTMNAYSASEAESLYGDVYISTDTEMDDPFTICNLVANLVGGDFTENPKVGGCNLYDDGSLTYRPSYVDYDEDGFAMPDYDRMDAEMLTFTREFSAPVLSVDRKASAVSGTWIASEDGELWLLELYKDGIFYLYQEGETVFGKYKLSENNLLLIAHEVDGEKYTSDDAFVTVTLDENGNIVMGEQVIAAVNGGVAAEYTSDDGYTLKLCNDGTFYMNRADNQAVGVYVADSDGYTLCTLAGGGYPEKEICIAEKDGDALSFYFTSEGDDNRIIFNKK